MRPHFSPACACTRMRARVRGAAGINFTDADARAAPTSRVHLNGHSRRGGITLIAGDGGSPFISRIVALDLGRSMKNNDTSAARGLSPRQADGGERSPAGSEFHKSSPPSLPFCDHAQNFLFLFRRASCILVFTRRLHLFASFCSSMCPNSRSSEFDKLCRVGCPPRALSPLM